MTILPIITLPFCSRPVERTHSPLWRCLALLCCLAVGSDVFAQGAPAEKRLKLLQQNYEKLQAQFAKNMEELAQVCEAQSFLTDAEQIRRRALPPESGAYDLDALPTELLPAIPLNLPAEERIWRLKLRKLETDYAGELYKIAREALHKGYPSLVFSLIREAAFHDPDHRNARAMLGYVQDKGKWTTSFRRMMDSKKLVDHPRFGWIEEKIVPRYENGERQFDGEWMSAEKEAALRREFKFAWEVGTEHFLVKTNHSLEKGVEISRELEKFHDFFLREYTAFFNSPAQMERLLDSPANARWNPASRYNVYYYRNKEEFVAALKPRNPNIEKANGLYMPYDRIAYFYCDEQPDDIDEERADRLETMYHEVTHQLLGESRSRTKDVGEKANFWIIEGFPCYLESYRPDSKSPHVGNPRHIRIYWARRRALEENVYWPMRQFTSIGKADFPLEADAYNQAAGMAHFFLNYEDGLYRDAFIQYLSQVYDPAERLRNASASLENLTGVKYEVLDRQYKEYLQLLPSDPPPGIQIINVESKQ